MTASFAYLHTATAAELAAAEALVVVLHRREIESGLVGPVVERLMDLSDDDALARRHEGRLHLVFEGYGRQPPWQDRTCRRFFRALTDQWPYWFHFLERRDGSLRLALLLLVDVTEVHRRGHAPAAVFDPALLTMTVKGMLYGLEGLHGQLRLDADHTHLMSTSVLRAIGMDGACRAAPA